MAALFVALMHAEHVFGDGDLFIAAGLMVDFFFMLSGFVMARTYEDRMGSDLGPRQFLMLRARRLWAPIAIGVVIGLFLYLRLGTSAAPAAYLTALGLLMLPNLLLPTEPFPFNPPQWSISYELIGNFLHAGLLWRLDVRKLALVLAVCAIVLFIWPWMDIRETPWSLAQALARLMFSYTAGVLIWRVLGDRPRLPLWIAFVGLSLTLPISTLAQPFVGSQILNLIVMLVMPVILIAGLTPITGRIAGRVAAVAGALSFPLYAVHSPTLMLVHVLGGPKWLAFTLSLALAALISALVEKKLFTKPLAARGLMAPHLRGTEGAS
jgi:peptidoglycan/LPS O-acetylase OafA/YrhL